MLTTSKDIASLPNIRKMFIPDSGSVIFDADLAGADAQVVAWEAGDEDLKAAFRAGVKIHMKNAEDIFGEEWRNAPGHHKDMGTKKGQMYYDNKRAVHATNYGASARTLAIVLGWSIARANQWQESWFRKHPEIHLWQRRVDAAVHSSRHCVENAFGFRRTYFDRADGILPQALAWIPQSTVARVCARGAINLINTFPFIERNQLLQVHDSIVFQVPKSEAYRVSEFKKALEVTVPYPDPLTISWSLSSSEKSWGDCR